MSDLGRETILVVDDVAENIAAMSAILGEEYRVTFATNGADALTAASAQPQPNLILLDLLMPEMDGHEVCRRLKADLRTQAIPVIFVTASSDANDEEQGLMLGAVDYLHKPCHPAIVRQRVRIHLDLRNQNMALEKRVRERTIELERTRLQVVQRLSRAGEYRSNETGMHVVRMGHYCYRLALAAGLPEVTARLLEVAVAMHDIGKIGIPDHILLKRGKLDDSEQTVMQLHTLIGPEIIGDDDSELLSMARSIAATHHERWDGEGYPKGLSGNTIPIEGRIAAICDAFDTLTSASHSRRPMRPEEAGAYITGEAGKAFDPELVSLFAGLRPEFQAIRVQFSDATARAGPDEKHASPDAEGGTDDG